MRWYSWLVVILAFAMAADAQKRLHHLEHEIRLLRGR